jgi:hypothetical protein
VHRVLNLVWSNLMWWWAGLLLEPVILIRSLWTRIYKRYPIFYLYMLCVFVVSAVLYIGTSLNPQFYIQWYWPTQLVTLVIGYGVIVDVWQKSLHAYPGAERAARTVGFAIFFVVFLWFAALYAWGPHWSLSRAVTRLERDLRFVEALFLATTIVAVRYYGIQLGRNLKGLAAGMCLYVGVSLICLALFSFLGHPFDFTWKMLQSGSYTFALGIWTYSLWNYAPNPDPPDDSSGGYSALANETRAKLNALGQHLGGKEQP